MPPTIITGKVYGADGNLVSGATVSLTHSSGVLSEVSSSVGEYVFNLGNLSSWSVGDTIIITATKTGEGTQTETLTIHTGGNTQDIYILETSTISWSDSFAHRLDFTIPLDYAGNKLTSLNPLPVFMGKPEGFSNATKDITWDSGNPIKITITIGDDVYVKTITWVGGNPTKVTGWIKQ